MPDGGNGDGPAPSVPVLQSPLPDVYIGRHSAPGTLRTTFSWKASTATDGLPISYQLQFSSDPAFASGVLEATASEPTYSPTTDFAVSQTPPVGTRYYWRVRACTTAKCSDYSAARWVSFGRNNRDFNGDGFSDVVAGAPRNSAAGTNSGRAYVYFGGAGGAFNAGADGVLSSTAAGDQFGVSVAPAGDLNGDGFTDLAVGATLADGAGGTPADVGTVSIYFGGDGATFDGTPDAVLYGTVANARFGRQVAAAGDVNGDGFGDLIVGAHYPEATGVGRAYLYFGGGGAFDKTADGTLTGEAGEAFGGAVSSAGDINRDGFADVLVGAYFSDIGSTDAGRALLFLGGAGASFDSRADQIFTQNLDKQFGYSVASAGDLNGDGFADIVISAPGPDVNSTDQGRVYAYFGTEAGVLPAEPNVTFAGTANGEAFGRSISSAGDLNGDGLDDLLVGAYANATLGGGTGRVYVFFGGRGTLDTANDGSFTGLAALDSLGNSVALAGDVNGDGFSDVIVGAPGNDAGCAECGRAYLFFGRSGTFDSTPRGLLTGSVAGEFLGQAVAVILPRRGGVCRAST